MRRLVTLSLGVLALTATGALEALADCMSACDDAYQTAVAACEQQYGDGGLEAQLQECLDDAQDRLGQCNETCVKPD